MQSSKLDAPPLGLVLYCGGQRPKKRFSLNRGRCPMQTVVPFSALENNHALFEALRERHWYLAVGSTGPEAEVVDGNLHIPGGAILDALCPACGDALLAKLRT